MFHLKSTLVFAATAFACVSSALAGAGTLNTVVTPLSSNVTYSIPGAAATSTTPAKPALVTYVGYTVSVANAGGNTINHIRFTGGTAVTDAAEAAVFDSAEGAVCTATNEAKTEISCSIGTLGGGQAFPTFAVFFVAPAKKTNGVADGAGQDFVNFAGETFYAEGSPTPDNSIRDWTATAALLGTSNPLVVKSSVPKLGGTFFTGDAGVTKGADKFSTFVVVPSAASYTTAEINEVAITEGCVNFTTCFESGITIPGTFSPYLTVVLRQDSSNIKPGTKIGSVVIRYVDSLTLVESIVGECASGPQPNANGVPCIAKPPVYYKSKSVPGWTPDLDGDFEWTLISLKNGRWIIN